MHVDPDALRHTSRAIGELLRAEAEAMEAAPEHGTVDLDEAALKMLAGMLSILIED